MLFAIRIIPADAGSTSLPHRYADCKRDHPRGCGEHNSYGSPVEMTVGSSPRMRGAPGAAPSTMPRPRIIPADAGSTPSPTGVWACPWDHPRGCGEHPPPCPKGLTPLGSSPRMRGARKESPRDQSGRRIIPADAGSTKGVIVLNTLTGDHPRGCGEHFSACDGFQTERGSSPRMRGAHLEILAIPTI